MTKILVVDDEAPFVRSLAISLRAREYEVNVAASGEDGLRSCVEDPPDVVILDLGLPRMDGVDVVRALRAWSDVPVLVLSARHTEDAKVDALDAGADDYVTKPFALNEFLARLRAVLRRRQPASESAIVTTPDFTIDLAAKTVHAGDDLVRLTKKEWGFVELLVRNQGRLVTQKEVLHEVWGPEYDTETDYLRTFLSAIRRKLEPQPAMPRYFITEPGMGYRFVAE